MKLMKLMVLGAAVVFCTEDVSAKMPLRDVFSLSSKQESLAALASNSEQRFHKGVSEEVKNSSDIVSQEVSDQERKSKIKKTVLITAGVVVGGGSLALLATAYAPGFCAIGMYEGLKYVGLGTFKSWLVAGSVTTLIADFSGVSCAVGAAGLGVTAKCFNDAKQY